MPPVGDIFVEPSTHVPIGRRRREYVERKGIGHPDTICDSVMEAISIALSQEYLQTAGRVLHHNLDKGLLVAGRTTPKLGGGVVEAPMKLVIGDRATLSYDGKPLPVQDIVLATARRWFQQHLRFVDPAVHLVVQNELQPGSAELVAIYSPPRDPAGQTTGQVGSAPTSAPVANDTSVAVGYAPLSETEHLVLAAEHFLNSPSFKKSFPETGEDVKVMGIRRDRVLSLTVAIAYIDHFIWDPATYFHRKAAAQVALQEFLATKLHELDQVEVQVNMLDNEQRGLDGMYLTVLGTSAESADGGEVGRGNRVNGLISFGRPMTTEAAAGKNPVGHVGKIYNVLAHRVAARIHQSVAGIEEAYVWICSQIGHPLNQPFSVSVQVALSPGASVQDVERPIADMIGSELADISTFTAQVTRGAFHVC